MKTHDPDWQPSEPQSAVFSLAGTSCTYWLSRPSTSGNEASQSTTKKRKRLASGDGVDQEPCDLTVMQPSPERVHHMSAFVTEGVQQSTAPETAQIPEEQVASITADIAAAIAQAQAQAALDGDADDGEPSDDEAEPDLVNGADDDLDEGPSVVAGAGFDNDKDDLDEWVNQDAGVEPDDEHDAGDYGASRLCDSEDAGG